MLKEVLEQNHWRGKVDLKDAYLTVPIHHSHTGYLKFFWKGKAYKFVCLPFGLASAPRTFTKILKPVANFLRSQGVKMLVYIDDILVTADTKESLRQQLRLVSSTLTALRVCSKYQEVHTRTHSTDRVFGYDDRLKGDENLSTKGKDRENQKVMQVCPAPQPHGQTDVTSNRTSDIITPSCSHSTPSHQSSTKSKDPGSTTWIIQLRGDYGVGSDGRPTVVDTTTGSSSWSSHCSNLPTNSPHLRRIQNRMGSIMSTSKNRGKMDTSRIQCTYQCIGTYSSLVCPEELREFGIRQACSDPNGQSNCGDLLEQDGRYSCEEPVRLSPADMAVESGEKHTDNSRILTWERKCDSRSGITPSQRCQRLEARHTDIQSPSTEMGTIQCRSICSETQQTDPNIFQLESRSSSSSSERNGARVGSTNPICFSPIHSDRQSAAENEAGSSVGSMFDHTAVESTAVVSFSTGNVHRFPSADSDEGRHINGSRSKSPLTGTQWSYPISRLESVRHTLKSQGISGKATSIILSSWRKGTEASYTSAWHQWNCWCNQRNYDPVSAPVEAVLEFLTEEFHKGKQYSTLNSYRSSISMTHVGVKGIPVGIMSRFMKGIFNLRPPCPRYTSSWDVSAVLEFISAQGENESLSLKQVTLKLTMLMALTSAGRSSDIHGLDLKFRKFTPQGVEFTIAKLTKTRKSGPPKQILFPSFQSYRVLCPVACLRYYEKITEKLRDTRMNTNPLFIAHCKPHKPVTSSTIARWLKGTMKGAGIVTSIFKAHSCRGAAASAKDHGVAVADIMKTADWSRETTFTRYYYRADKENYLGRTVLGQNKVHVIMYYTTSNIHCYMRSLS